MRKNKIFIVFILILLMCTSFACNNNNDTEVGIPVETVNPTKNETDDITPVDSEPSEEEETSEKEQATEAAPSESPEKEVVSVDVNYDPNFELIVEAETTALAGKLKVENSKAGYTGDGYLVGIEGPDDIVTFTITVPGDGAYDLNFISASFSGAFKENNILVDGEMIGVAKVESEEFVDSKLERIYLTAGEHKVQMSKSWGWIYLDSLKITASAPADQTIYEVSAELVDPKASESSKKLMQYLADVYGEYIISGQYGDRGTKGPEFKAIEKGTGKVPAMMGLDFMDYTPSRVANGSVGKDVMYALNFNKDGGIVTFCWHWNAPEPYLVNSSTAPWYRGFYVEASNIDLAKIMNGKDQAGYDLLIRDMDAIAEQLKILQKADVPVLWRPLHEASGGWFWWGAAGPEAYIKLYQLMYDRYTNYHGLHNLIWVWNGQDKDWYPGNDYVDLVGVDIYPGEKVYTSQVAKFNELVSWIAPTRKIIALTENGCHFDPDLAFRDNAMWSYFGTWEGDFITLNNSYTLSEKYTETDMLNKVYNHEKVITLDELPDLKTYGD